MDPNAALKALISSVQVEMQHIIHVVQRNFSDLYLWFSFQLLLSSQQGMLRYTYQEPAAQFHLSLCQLLHVDLESSCHISLTKAWWCPRHPHPSNIPYLRKSKLLHYSILCTHLATLEVFPHFSVQLLQHLVYHLSLANPKPHLAQLLFYIFPFRSNKVFLIWYVAFHSLLFP